MEQPEEQTTPAQPDEESAGTGDTPTPPDEGEGARSNEEAEQQDGGEAAAE